MFVAFWEWFVFTFLVSSFYFAAVFFATCLLTVGAPRLIVYILANAGVAKSTRQFISMISGVFIFSAGLVLGFEVAGIPIIGFGVTFGAFSYIAGIGVKDVFPNMIASIALWTSVHHPVGTVLRFTNDAAARRYAIGQTTIHNTVLYEITDQNEVLLTEFRLVPNADFINQDIVIVNAEQISKVVREIVDGKDSPDKMGGSADEEEGSTKQDKDS